MSNRMDRSGSRPNNDQAGAAPPKFLRVAQGCALIASIGVGFATFWGLRDYFILQGGLIGWLLPLSLGTVVTVMVAFAWHMLMEMASDE